MHVATRFRKYSTEQIVNTLQLRLCIESFNGMPILGQRMRVIENVFQFQAALAVVANHELLCIASCHKRLGLRFVQEQIQLWQVDSLLRSTAIAGRSRPMRGMEILFLSDAPANTTHRAISEHDQRYRFSKVWCPV